MQLTLSLVGLGATVLFLASSAVALPTGTTPGADIARRHGDNPTGPNGQPAHTHIIDPAKITLAKRHGDDPSARNGKPAHTHDNPLTGILRRHGDDPKGRNGKPAHTHDNPLTGVLKRHGDDPSARNGKPAHTHDNPLTGVLRRHGDDPSARNGKPAHTHDNPLTGVLRREELEGRGKGPIPHTRTGPAVNGAAVNKRHGDDPMERNGHLPHSHDSTLAGVF